MNRPPPGCPVEGGIGCVGAVGPKDSKILLVGEAPGDYEARHSTPFFSQAPAGNKLDKLLAMRGVTRDQFRITNAIQCRPQNNYIHPKWADAALQHCSPHLQSVLNEGHRVVVPMGGYAIQAVSGLPRGRGKESIKVKEFHGAPFRDPLDRFWIVPTFHPSFILQEGAKFTKVWQWDFQRALDIAADLNWKPDEPELIIDPDPVWFASWVEYYLANAGSLWLAIDVETPDKGKKSDEGTLKGEDQSWQILRVNLSYSTDQGVTVPWVEPFRSIAARAISAPGVKCFWNITYDQPRLERDGVPVGAPAYDFMDAFHVTQSSLPKGLGFVSPLHSARGPWKHLGNGNLTYCALDGVQTLRCSFGIARELQQTGMWTTFERRYYKVDTYCLRPGEKVGILMDRPRLEALTQTLTEKRRELTHQLRALVPSEVLKLSNPMTARAKPWVLRPGEDEFDRPEYELITREGVPTAIKVCLACGAKQVHVKHRCENKELVPEVVGRMEPITRWFKRFAFNPQSRDQVMAYALAKKHKLGKNRKTKRDSVDIKTVNRLIRTGDEFYRLLKQHREVSKHRGTYGIPMLAKLDSGSRIHPSFKHNTSTHRLSSSDPNWQNITHHGEWAPHFRRCVVAAPGCRLLAADYAGIEAVQTGWWARDPDYIRLAKFGVHAYVCSHLVGEPASLEWDDEKLGAYLMKMKADHKDDGQYDRAKRCVHGTNYGLTEFGMIEQFPETFPDLKSARQVQAVYFRVCPKLKAWHAQMRELAYRRNYLGGIGPWPSGHPFGFKAWFWDVYQFRKNAKGEWKPGLGGEAKSVIAFGPQSTAAGVLAEAMIRLFVPGESHENWIGDAYYGSTPFRAQIHDELLLEVPEERYEEVRAKVVREMRRPIKEQPLPEEWGMGPYLQIDVEVKTGLNWASKDPKHAWSDDGNPDGMVTLGKETLAGDVEYEYADDEEEDEDQVAGLDY